jgi:transketolase
MEKEKQKFLKEKAKEARENVLRAIHAAGQGHIGGCLSVVDLLTVLYYSQMDVSPEDTKREDRDRLVLSKGHAGPALYSILAMKGFFPQDWLLTLNKPGTMLPSHCDMLRTPGIDMTAGSLGQGISAAVGIALGAKIKENSAYTFAILGDGESQEGSVWEASMAAAQYGLENLIVFLDYNKLQIDGTTDEIMSLLDPVSKWDAFGFETWRIDGHDIEQISDTVSSAKASKNGRPKIIVLDTVKGKGVSFIESEGAANHSMPISDEVLEKAISELDKE